jgi:hypothetical protein
MRIWTAFVFVILCQSAVCQYSLSGKILNKNNNQPVEYAYVEINDREQWATADENGEFLFKGLAAGEVKLSVSCLGYAKRVFTTLIKENNDTLVLYLPEDNLTLDEVVVTARKSSGDMATSFNIDRAAIEHLQMIGIADIMSLLPGGQTNTATHLATSSAQTVAVRGSTSEKGSPTFGSAIEIDGVRLSNNASFGQTTSSYGQVYGIDTRNIATGAIESVEIITGIPSVEYGDLSNGMVKIHSRRGKSPLHVELSTKPNTKQASANKGFDLRKNFGTLNAAIEYTRSISDIASPFTSYNRNGLSLIYENTFAREVCPLTLTAGFTGNAGGYNSKTDPDAFRDTYHKISDNTFRGHFNIHWLLNRKWITNLETSASISSNHNLTSENTNKSSSSSVVAIHGREEGYFIAQKYEENPTAAITLIPGGYWYELAKTDSRLLNTAAKVKAVLNRQFGSVRSNLFVGADFNRSENKGRGLYYDDLLYAPTWREYRYSEVPAMNNLAVYAEEKLTLTLKNSSSLQIRAGLRPDFTFVPNSEYGSASSLSPRLNVKYIHPKFSVYAGWGKAVKLPSFSILYPAPSYSDKVVFAPGTTSDGTTFLAYYLRPYSPEYNPALKWQYNRQSEIGFETKILGANISISGYYNKIFNAYTLQTNYLPFAYSYTDNSQLETSLIPSADRHYEIDRTTGVITVFDKTGLQPQETLSYREMRTFKSSSKYINGSPATQSGIDWTVDFGKIEAIKTAVRIDGKYYRYRGTEETIDAYSPVSQMMTDGNYYKYIGFYAGGANTANGRETREVNGNVTFTTHIPQIRLIFSLRIESTLYDYTQNLSEYGDATRSFILDSRNDYFPSASQNGIYNTNSYVGLYPLYYISYDDMDTQIPFAEKFAWAKENDPALYNELSKLVVKTNTDYYFNANRISAYYSANISITKEIGDIATISFYARNFLNNMQLIKSSNNNTESSIYGSSYIPGFYYGLSLKIKM